MYKVTKEHHRPYYRKGDLEDEWITLDIKLFKRKKDAKAYIESELRGKSDVYRHTSRYLYMCGYRTGYTWTHENTGDECEETYNYRLTKEKVQ